MMDYEIGIDMGGTHTGIGLVKGTSIVDKIEFITDVTEGPKLFVDALSDNIDMLIARNGLTKEDIEAVGMGVPGSANRDTGLIEYANNLGFENVPLQDMISEKINLLVNVDNDANLAAYGEYIMSGSKAKSFMLVTLGTGVGAGIILNGEIYRGINYAEGEVGHMTIKYDGIECNCGRRGCFEAYASTNALVKMACDKMHRNRSSLLWKYPKIDGKAVFEAAAEKDRAVCEVLDEYTTLLSEGLANLVNIFQPEELVIGGGISAASELFLPDTVSKVSGIIYSRNSWKNTRISAARFGNDAGIIGAAKLR